MGDVQKFREISRRPNLFPVLINSFARGIFGNEKVKAGILLSILGGSNNTGTRNTIHLMMVGDPGIGKTQILKAAVGMSTRGVYVSAGSTKAGLTVTVNRDSGNAVMQAGALVLSD
jgi:DNA helicase MCM8